MSATAENVFLDPATLDFNSPEFAKFLELPDIDADATSTSASSDTTEQDEQGANTSGAVDTTTEQRLPIANRSNTGTIPYGVLEGTRHELASTKDQLNDALTKLRELESAKPGAVEVPKPGEVIEAEIEGAQAQADELEVLAKSMEEDFPEFGKAVRTIVSRFETQIGALNKRLEDTARVTNQVQRERVKTEEQLVQDAVDANSYLSAWANGGDVEAWNLAYEHDQKLMADPKWAGKPYAERFAKAVQYTLVDKPDAKKPEAQPKQSTSATEDADADARVTAALKAADKFVPKSLSHIPSGESPAPNELSNLSVTQLEAQMANMTPDQIGLMLSRVG
jgi:hypothetical protein